MNTNNIWDQIYLHCIEIRDLEPSQEGSIQKLREHLSTIELLIPEDSEPDSQFELYVMGRLCRYVENCLPAK